MKAIERQILGHSLVSEPCFRPVTGPKAGQQIKLNTVTRMAKAGGAMTNDHPMGRLPERFFFGDMYNTDEWSRRASDKDATS